MGLSHELASLDRAVALDRVGGDAELLQEIAGLFLEEYPKLMQAMWEAIAAGDAGALESAAHSLKGAVGNFGAQNAHQAALRLEMLARRHEMPQVAEAFQVLEAAMQALHPALVELRSTSFSLLTPDMFQ